MRNDGDAPIPLRGFRFLVEIDGLTSGGFQRVKGLQREVKHESYREGGVNDYEHKLITQVSYPARGARARPCARRSVEMGLRCLRTATCSARMSGSACRTRPAEKAWAWQLEWALPVKWSCSDLDAGQSQVVMESLELAHHGLSKAT